MQQMQIIRGRQTAAKKVVIYGPEGIGKSTFAAHFPDPIFIDTEGSTTHMDLARTPRPSSFAMLLEQIRYFSAHPDELGTLVIDTADWAERLATDEVCASANKKGIEDFGYGKGYVYVFEKIGQMLDMCSTLIERGVNVVITAHALMRKFEQPDEMGSYDRWELKLGKKTGSQTAPLLKEWADLLLFANYKTYVINLDDQGAAKGKNKVQGGKRVMYTSHHSCWDAKNRFELADELPFDYAQIAHLFTTGSAIAKPGPTVQPDAAMTAVQPTLLDNIPPQIPAALPSVTPNTSSPKEPDADDETGIPQTLLDLMHANDVKAWEIQFAVSGRGYYPNDTSISRYAPDFVQGCLVAAWPQVLDMIQKNRSEIPF